MPALTNLSDLSLHPYVRGFWTDDEMFAATGATSLGLIKGMQKDGLISPGKHKNANGKLARAWDATDLFRIALAVDFADETGFSLLVATKILSALRPDRIDFVLSTRDTLNELAERMASTLSKASKTTADGLPEGWAELQLITGRPEVLDLKIVDRQFVMLTSRSNASPDEFDETPLGVLQDVKGSSPSLTLSTEDKRPTFYEDERSVLIVRLSCLADLPLRNAFGTTAYPNAWVR